MNDNQDVNPKAFDVMPPTAMNSQAASTAPKVIVKNDPMLTSAPADSTDNSVNNNQAEEELTIKEQSITSTTPEKTLQPISDDIKNEQPTDNIEQKATVQTENEDYVSTDAVPDAPSSTDLKNSDTTSSMQQPKIFDTNEYFVPIHETSHRHGFVKGSLIAGLVAAILVLVVVAILSFWVSK